jgi:hypothetical protein
MPNKFRKRSIERKGTRKELEKERKLLDKDVESLASVKEATEEFVEETSPEEEV